MVTNVNTPRDADGDVDLTDRDDVDRLRVVVLRLARRIRHHSPGTITPSQRFALATIVRHGRLTVGQIADLEHIQPPAASKIVSALESEGFVTRSVSAADRRCTHIVATDAGRAYLDRARAAGRSWMSDQLTQLDPDDVESIGSALPALERLLEVDG
ncbi:MAG: MarR family transcriptional regulator [Acidimicrobiaceae bacterium]|nr:MarR family transcriptional regulator [Acidimicrobiaceae bacterium]